MHHNQPAKNNSPQHWLNSFAVKPRLVLTLGVFWLAVFLGIAFSPAVGFFQVRIEHPISFKIRDVLGRSPEVDPRLKIYAFDDAAMGKYGEPMESKEMWAAVIHKLARRNPRAIIIDSVFSSRLGPISNSVEREYNEIARSKVPVITGAFTMPVAIPNKYPLEVKQEIHDLGRYVNGLENGGRRPDWIEKMPTRYAYGPSQSYAKYFKHVGHFQMLQDHRVAPFLKISDDQVLPHLTLLVADHVEIGDHHVLVNDVRVAIDRDGSIPINFLPRSKFKIKSMANLIEKSRLNQQFDGVQEGDVVLLLPLFFTGNTDFRPSPYGMMSGGLFLAASINSVLTGHWLQPVMAERVLVTSAIVVSMLAAYLLSATGLWIAWFVGSAGFFGAIQAAFAYLGLEIAFVLPLIAGFVSSLSIHILKVKSSEKKTQALRVALDGAVSPTQLENIIQNSNSINLEPRERVVTLMFIDIVGFSLLSENMLPRTAFDNLKTILNKYAEIIYKHGGIIDKTLGDGLLCYFGYRFDNDSTDSDHPERALRCAIEIQKESLKEGQQAAVESKPIYPLRIGINTASCFLGDLGSANRIEFTVVGNGVNFAKRLESACEMYAVMIGPTTYDMIKGLDFGANQLSRKMIKIKHHSHMLDAYEVSAWSSNPAARMEVIDAYRKIANLQRNDDRIYVKESSRISVVTPQGLGKLVNFSETGLSVVLKTPMSRGSKVELKFECTISSFVNELAKLQLPPLQAEVRWSYVTAEGIAHGLMYLDFSKDHQKALARLLTEYSFMENIDNSKGSVDNEKAS